MGNNQNKADFSSGSSEKRPGVMDNSVARPLNMNNGEPHIPLKFLSSSSTDRENE